MRMHANGHQRAVPKALDEESKGQALMCKAYIT